MTRTEDDVLDFDTGEPVPGTTHIFFTLPTEFVAWLRAQADAERRSPAKQLLKFVAQGVGGKVWETAQAPSDVGPASRGLLCSFCGKSASQVEKLLASREVYICDKCVVLCNDIIAETKPKGDPTP